MKRFLFLLPLLSSGCLATRQDFDQLQADVAAWKAGTITDAELETSVQKKGDDIQERTRAWIELAIGLASAFGFPATAAGVMFMRNRNILTKGVRVPPEAHIEIPITNGLPPVPEVIPTIKVEAASASKKL